MFERKRTNQEEIIRHYEKVWENKCKVYLFDKGPYEKLPFDFRVLEFPPTNNREMWTYSTCCMSQIDDECKVELHIFSSKKDETLIELLTATAFYHKNNHSINLNNTINFGRAWQEQSECTYGFISLPYLDGSSLETLQLKNNIVIKFYWVIPITEKELNFKIEYGHEALEEKFEEKMFNYFDSHRESLI